jgi:hypothetical protein
VAGFPGSPASAQDDPRALWQFRNLGAAYLDNEDPEEAAKALARAAQLAPDGPGDLRNAGIAALRAGDLIGARALLERARDLAPEEAGVWYALGLLAKRESDLEAARGALLRCRELGGSGPELAYNLGIVAVRRDDAEDAIAEFGRVVDAGPDLAPRHYASALYRRGRGLVALGRREEGAAALGEYRDLVRAGAGAQLSEEELEVGPLLALVEFPRPADPRVAGPVPAFSREGLPAPEEIRWAGVHDLDGDGDRDLLLGDGQTIRDLRRTENGWTDVTASRGLAGLLGVTQARALDLDDDGSPDLVRAGGAGIALHPGVEGGWDPPLPICRETVSRFVPVDFDHEGDVDLLAAGLGGPLLFRNNGDRTFADVTAAAGFEIVGPLADLAPGDLDDDRDVDLFFVTRDGRVLVASNLRGGRFEVLSPLTGAADGAFAVALADLDGDGDLDLATAGTQGVAVTENLGGLEFAATGTLVLPAPVRWPAPGGESLWARDFDNDGRVDLLCARESGGELALNQGGLSFAPTSEPLRPLTERDAWPIGAELVDEDGRVDLLVSRADFALALNIASLPPSLVVFPRGTKNNPDGVGAILELLSGPRALRADADGGPVHFGLGPEGRIDALRVQWPNGIRQAVLDATPDVPTVVEERAGLVGSCPFLYTWNGERTEYVTDILTVTPLGLPVRPGSYVPPDRDEVIRVTEDQMVPDEEGWLVAQVTEELREVTYLDQVRLYAIDHPTGIEVQPNEKFKFPPFPEFGVHVLDAVRPPHRATDHLGRDVTEKLVAADGLVVGDLPLTGYQGITEMHDLVIDFGEVPPDAPLTLHLTGWFHWTNASINLAVHQNPRHAFVPPSLQVPGPDGEWVDFPVEVGFPGGKTKTIPVDLGGAFPDGRAKIRLATTLRLYWDRALLQVGEPVAPTRVTMILPDAADLHWRGHSEPILSITGEEPEVFDYDVMRKTEVPWDQHPGRYTRYGDVTPLLQDAEDMYVIMASGDECTVKWRADRLPPLGSGWSRTWFLLFDGWAKDGDPNTSLADEVGPLPFHGMSGYPYGPDESYPSDEAHEAYRREWNTRPGVRLGLDFVAEARARTTAPVASSSSTSGMR